MYILGASCLLAHHFDGRGPHQPATIIVPLQWPGVTVIPPLPLIYCPPSPHPPPLFSPILYIVLLCLVHALFSVQGKSDWDWGLCPPSLQEFLDP